MRLAIVAGTAGVLGLAAAAAGLGGPYWIGLRHANAHLAMPEGLFRTLLLTFARSQVASILAARGQAAPDAATMASMTRRAADNILQALISQGLITREGARYAATVDYESGRLNVNGKPVAARMRF